MTPKELRLKELAEDLESYRQAGPKSEWWVEGLRDRQRSFSAAANPATVLKLLARIERLEIAAKELLEDLGHKHRACIVKTRDNIDGHEWDAWMNKATAYADCENALRATLNAIEKQQPVNQSEE